MTLATIRRCSRCHTYLRAGNPEPMCGPCLLETWQPEPAPTAPDDWDGYEMAEAATKPAHALLPEPCHCDRPLPIDDEDDCRCLTCGRHTL